LLSDVLIEHLCDLALIDVLEDLGIFSQSAVAVNALVRMRLKSLGEPERKSLARKCAINLLQTWDVIEPQNVRPPDWDLQIAQLH
jgi:hypothetical protein